MLKMKIFLVLALAVTAWSAELPGCHVSEWGPYGECHPSKQCEDADSNKPVSFPLKTPVIDDKGRAMMKLMNRMKEEYWAKMDLCQKYGECPEMNNGPTMGPAKCENGMAGEYPCRNLDQLSQISIDDLGYRDKIPGDTRPRGNDIWGWTDPENNDEYVIIGLSGGSSFVRVTDPENPQVLAFLYSRTTYSTWRDMKVINNTVYIVSEARNHGMQVYDLTLLRGKNDFSIVEATAEYALFGNAHNIVSNEETNTLYVVGATDRNYQYSCSGGLHMIDVSEPLNPKYAGCFADDGYVHDAQCVVYRGRDRRYFGREVCWCYNEDTLTLVDVTNKNDMKMISRTGYSTSQYTHQGWLTEDQSIALLDDELDESRGGDQFTKTYIWDCTDLEEPVLMNVYRSPNRAIDHNQYVHLGLTYQSNYGSGLRILHINQAEYDLQEVAYFDCFPARTEALFEGTWSNYPYFKSGNIAVSSIEYGLFMVRPDYAAIEQEINGQTKYAEKMRTRKILYAKEGATCPHLEEFQQCDAKC